MNGVPINTYSGLKLEALPGFAAITDALAFMPDLTIARGTLLAQVSAADVNAVQTIDFSSAGNAPNGGTFTLAIVGTDGATYSTAALAYNISNANIKIAIEALLLAAGYAGATVTITGGAAPTDVVVTFGGTAAAWDMPLMTVTNNLTSAGTATVTVADTTPGNKIGLWGPYVGTKLADPTTAPTVAWKGSGGYFPVDSTHVVCITLLTAQGETLPSPGVILAKSSATDSIDVTPATLPAGTTGINIYVDGLLAATSAQTTATKVNVPGVETTLALGALAAKAPPRVNTAFTNTDGRHVAKAIAMCDFRTNSLGKVAEAGATQQPQYGIYDPTSPGYFSGAFKTSELTGLTADAIADLSGRLIKGTLADGVLVF
jgi:hypothetical protein